MSRTEVQLFELLVDYVLARLLPYLLVRWDRRHLSAEQLARGWNEASTAAAIVFWGPWSIPAHYWVTRRTLSGVARGLVALVGVLVTVVFLSFAIHATVEWLAS